MAGRRGRSAPDGSRGRLSALLATIAAPLVIYLVVRAALVGLPDEAAAQAALLPPADHRPVARQLLRAALLPGLGATPEMLDTSRKAILSSPLSYEPFVIAAKAAEQIGNARQAMVLLEESRRRRPSHLLTRVNLAARYTQLGRPMDALEEIDVALRLSDKARYAILPHLTKLMDSREGRDALATILASEPLWREDFLRTAGEQKLDPAKAMSLVELVSAKKKGRDLGPEQAFLVQSHVSAGDFPRARELWAAALPDAQPADSLVFDGSFKGRAASGPFGWKLHQLDVGHAEIAQEGGQSLLHVSYFGGKNAVLAEQTLALPPGQYRLSSRAKSSVGIKSGPVYWRLACLPEGNNVAALQLENLRDAFALAEASFTIPAGGCRGQKLSFVAEPGDVAGELDLQIANVEIRR